MKKRLLSIILAIVMVSSFSAFGTMAEETVTVAPVFTDITGLPCEEAVNHLAALGVVNGRSEGKYAPNEGLTRAEMTAIILRAFGSEEIEDIEKFKDVPTTHWAYMYVETAYKMGIINGMTANTFVPDGSVTYEQAVKMLVCAINKEGAAQTEGGWPDGYIKVASDLGALEGVTGQKGQAISRGTMAQMVYNFLAIANDEFSYMYDWENEPIADHYDWIKNERMRGIYGGIAEIFTEDNVFDRAYEAGANAFFYNYNAGGTGYVFNTREGQSNLMDIAEAQFHKYEGVHHFAKLNFGNSWIVEYDKYGAFHPGTPITVQPENPCPLAEGYWRERIFDQCKEIAGRPQWQGVCIDFEMHRGMAHYPTICKCDNCWSKFIATTGRSDEWKNVPPAERGDFVMDKNALEDYKYFYKTELFKLISKLRDEVHAINPEFIFTYMPGYESLSGITAALGTAERPVIVMSESEYWGCFATIKNKMSLIKAADEHALYSCGLYPHDKNALTPEEFGAAINTVATSTAGYWIYNTNSFARKIDENAAEMVAANKILEEDLAAGTVRPLPEYEVLEYTAKKIKGDTPTEAEWEAAPFTEDFVYYKNNTDPDGTPDVLTKAKILYNDDDLFVRTYCYDDMTKFKLPPEQTEREKGLWDDQCVEIYWKFDEDETLAQVAVNAADAIYDCYSHAIGQRDTTFNFESLETSTVLKEDRWEITTRIPGNPIGVRDIKTGDVLKMQISRYHPDSVKYGAQARNQPWVRTDGGYLGTYPIWATVYLD